MKTPIEIEWTCRCGYVNTDDFANTTCPTCENCLRGNWLWDDVLTQDQMNNANYLLDLQDPSLLVNQIAELVDSGQV